MTPQKAPTPEKRTRPGSSTTAAGKAAPKRRAATGTRTAPSGGAPARSVSRGAAGLDRSGTSQGHSPVEALLAEHVDGDAEAQVAAVAQEVGRAAEQAAQRGAARAAERRSQQAESARRPAHPAASAPAQLGPLPPAPDVLLGLASLMGEQAWRWGTRGVAFASASASRIVALVRGVAPSYATTQVEATLNALADRGRRVRQERGEALSMSVTAAISSAATSDAVREMAVAAIEEATDDVLAVMLPAMLEAVTELETQQRLDELMAGLLLRQLPSALERTLPGVMLRTATKPALGLVPFLGGAIPRGQ